MALTKKSLPVDISQTSRPGIKRSAARRHKRVDSTLSADGSTLWHGGDPLLSVLKLKDLRKNGYINWDGPGSPPAIDLDRAMTSIVDPLQGHTQIHPAFHEDNWFGLEPGDYASFEPALRLVSCLLAEPSILTFFNELLDRPMAVIDNEPARKRCKADKLYRFDCIPNDAPLYTRSLATTRTLIEMSQFVEFSFEDLGSNPSPYAITLPTLADGFIPKRTSGSAIFIRPIYLDVFRKGLPISQFPKTTLHDQDAATLRTHFLFAQLLLHEFTHAVYLATFPRAVAVTTTDATTSRPSASSPPTSPKPPPLSSLPPEPFFANNRISELGWAIESTIFSGRCLPSCLQVLKNADVCCPYGITLKRFPGGMGGISGGRHLLLASAKHYGRSGCDYAAVKQADVARFFTRAFWEKDVPGTNGVALRLPWVVAVRSKNGFWDRLFEGEVGVKDGVEVEEDMPGREALAKVGFEAFKDGVYDTSSSESGSESEGEEVAGDDDDDHDVRDCNHEGW